MLFTILIVLATVMILLCAVALLWDIRKLLTDHPRLFLGLSFIGLACWGFTTIINATQTDYQTVLLSTKLSYVSGIILLAFIHFFIQSLLPKHKKMPIIIEIFLGGLAIIIALVTLMSDIVVKDILFEAASGSKPVLGDFFYLYAAMFVPFFVLSIGSIYNVYKNAKAENVVRLKYVFMGMSFSGSLLLVTNMLLPLVGVDGFVPLVPYHTYQQ